MKAPFAATLICLCTQACAVPAAPAAPTKVVLADDAQASGAVQRSARSEGAASPTPAPARERGLLLAGFALMAGITLRRLGDGSP